MRVVTATRLTAGLVLGLVMVPAIMARPAMAQNLNDIGRTLNQLLPQQQQQDPNRERNAYEQGRRDQEEQLRRERDARRNEDRRPGYDDRRRDEGNDRQRAEDSRRRQDEFNRERADRERVQVDDQRNRGRY